MESPYFLGPFLSLHSDQVFGVEIIAGQKKGTPKQGVEGEVPTPSAPSYSIAAVRYLESGRFIAGLSQVRSKGASE